jgi:hypothetical protein
MTDARADKINADHAAIIAAGGLAKDKTLRDHFAGQALCSIWEISGAEKEHAKFAYLMADAMLEARKTPPKGDTP